DLRLALSERSLLYNVLEFGVLTKLQSPTTSSNAGFAPVETRDPSDERKDRGWQLSEDLLTLLRDDCARRGVRLVVVGIPTIWQVAIAESTPSPLVNIGQRIGVPVVDLVEPFHQAGPDLREQLYFPKHQ